MRAVVARYCGREGAIEGAVAPLVLEGGWMVGLGAVGKGERGVGGGESPRSVRRSSGSDTRARLREATPQQGQRPPWLPPPVRASVRPAGLRARCARQGCAQFLRRPRAGRTVGRTPSGDEHADQTLVVHRGGAQGRGIRIHPQDRAHTTTSRNSRRRPLLQRHLPCARAAVAAACAH